MPRPIRIEYENAFYHVMNRGRGRQAIFYGPAYFKAFLDTLIQAHQRFDAQIHAYCLMGNHYHLLIETPRANLGRIMRHINGIYTQQYNRFRNTDGPLFRGRYKAILVDETEYLLQLSRYIHLNPVAKQKSRLRPLEIYQWSSYPVYVGKVPNPGWLTTDRIYAALGNRQNFAAYERYIAADADEEFINIYNKGNTTAILGDKEFREKVTNHNQRANPNWNRALRPRPDIDKILQVVANHYQVAIQDLTTSAGKGSAQNFPRKVAMYYCQMNGNISLNEIAEKFGLNHLGGVSSAIAGVKRQREQLAVAKVMERIEVDLNSE